MTAPGTPDERAAEETPDILIVNPKRVFIPAKCADCATHARRLESAEAALKERDRMADEAIAYWRQRWEQAERRLEEARAALGRYGKHEKGSGCPVIFSDHFSDRLCTCGLAAALARLAPPRVEHAKDCMVRAQNEWPCSCGADGLVALT